jgi:FHS family L-fucose permease-like MFS transporter
MAGPSAVTTKPQEGNVNDRTLFFMSLALFFIWGFATVLIDILIPKFRGLYNLSYAEAMLTQSAFFLGYFVFSIPAGNLVAKVGYMRGIIAGLGVMIGGCILFVLATHVGIYPGFLFALFVLAAGITILQVAANAVISIAGAAETSSARLTLAQAFNSFGTFIGPFVGAKLILEGGPEIPKDISTLTPEALNALRAAEATALQAPYLGIATVLVLIMIVFYMKRDLLPPMAKTETPTGLGFHLLANKKVLFGVIAIFTYVGAEVAIGSVLVNYLSQASILGSTEAQAGKLVALYWGGAMVGRFAGSYILSRFPAGQVLAVFAVLAIVLAALAMVLTGQIAAIAILSIGLFNSIMFPTIFSQTVIGLNDEDTPKAAALLCMGIVGGAILPLVTGFAADSVGLSVALIVPILGYAWLVFFGLFVHRQNTAPAS